MNGTEDDVMRKADHEEKTSLVLEMKVSQVTSLLSDVLVTILTAMVI
jgi:hypothetical protein